MPIPLQKEIIYGPILSRRLGCSLGINLLSLSRKICTFDCLYCQYGFTRNPDIEFSGKTIPFHDVESIVKALSKSLLNRSEIPCDLKSVTLAGNGEPTLHPKLNKVIKSIKKIQKEFAPEVKLTILSNSGLVHIPEIRDALKLLDRRIMKLDGGSPETIERINKPYQKLDFDKMISGLQAIHPLMIQSFFLKGINDSDNDVNDWADCIEKIRPESVQVYSIDRPPADADVEKTPVDRLYEIADFINSKPGLEAKVFS